MNNQNINLELSTNQQHLVTAVIRDKNQSIIKEFRFSNKAIHPEKTVLNWIFNFMH